MENWDARGILNTFGPTFLFMTWIVAQYFRVRKQQRVEDGISEITRSLESSSLSITPFQVITTLRHNPPEEKIDEHFEEREGFKSLKENKFLKRTGTVRLGPIPYNGEEESPAHSQSQIEDDEYLGQLYAESGSQSTIVKMPFRFIIELSEKKKNGRKIRLEGVHRDAGGLSKVIGIRLYDDTIYQDIAQLSWTVSVSDGRTGGVKDLRNTEMSVLMDFTLCDVENVPSIHNSILCLAKPHERSCPFRSSN